MAVKRRGAVSAAIALQKVVCKVDIKASNKDCDVKEREIRNSKNGQSKNGLLSPDDVTLLLAFFLFYVLTLPPLTVVYS